YAAREIEQLSQRIHAQAAALRAVRSAKRRSVEASMPSTTDPARKAACRLSLASVCVVTLLAPLQISRRIAASRDRPRSSRSNVCVEDRRSGQARGQLFREGGLSRIIP